MAATRRRKQRRRGRFGFLYKLLSVLLILCAVVAGSIVFFRVEEIKVAGEVVYSEEEVVAASGLKPGDNLFLIRALQTAREIRTRLPYINDVNLRRALPDTVIISVTECAPAAVLKGEGNTWWIVDRNCKLLEQRTSKPTEPCPQVIGLTAVTPAEGSALKVADGDNARLDALKQILGALEDRGMLAKAQTIDLSGASEIHMSYEERFTVRLPIYSDDFPLLIHTLQAASEKLNSGQTGTIDLTVDLAKERARFIPD